MVLGNVYVVCMCVCVVPVCVHNLDMKAGMCRPVYEEASQKYGGRNKERRGSAAHQYNRIHGATFTHSS